MQKDIYPCIPFIKRSSRYYREDLFISDMQGADGLYVKRIFVLVQHSMITDAPGADRGDSPRLNQYRFFKTIGMTALDTLYGSLKR